MPIYMWSDSKIVLSWLKLEPSQLQVFVANRVTKIQSLTSSDSWHCVNTKENAADIASRGIFPESFLESQLWFQGPQFLRQHPDLWSNDSTDEVIELPELKRSVQVSLHSTVQNSWITNFITRISNLHKMKRVFSYVMRFIRNIKNKTRAPSLFLTVHETNDSFLLLIKLVQAESFHDEILCLLNDKPLSKKSRLLLLSPILDKGLLKVGGRLMHSTLPENVKTPILLPKFHVLTKLICTHYHVSNLHPGPQLLLSLIKQQYWPIPGKVLVKQIVRQCVKCFRVKPPHNCVKMGPLPNERIIPAYPFENVGLDYAGPFPLKEKKGRGSISLRSVLRIVSWSGNSSDGLRNPVSKGQRLPIFAFGNEDGFVNDSYLRWKSQSKTGDYHDDINYENYHKWLTENLLLNLPSNSVIVLDNAPYHYKREDKLPSSTSRKADMQMWLR
ncbi:uncharacterized protein [Diabrotica undecimpunctata]|uniref:uncharacterized protein n=1 Tax=Diabrotica undecimpunctata TaxID=50387 RepID=UPI003B6356D8